MQEEEEGEEEQDKRHGGGELVTDPPNALLPIGNFMLPSIGETIRQHFSFCVKII